MLYNNFENIKKSVRFNKDLYEYGREQERKVIDTLKVFFNDVGIIDLPEGYTFDFIGNNKLIELKSRQNNRLQYSDTAIGMNKIKEAKNYTGEVFFVFKFLDGLYYWKYDPMVKLRKGYINITLHYFIPVDALMPIII